MVFHIFSTNSSYCPSDWRRWRSCKVLTDAEVSVVMLEAGPSLNSHRDLKEHVGPFDLRAARLERFNLGI